MKYTCVLTLLLCFNLSACTANNVVNDSSYTTPTVPPILLQGRQQTTYQQYDITYIANQKSLESAIKLLHQQDTHISKQWNALLHSLPLNTPTSLQPQLFTTLDVIQSISRTNPNLTLLNDPDIFVLDDKKNTITLNKPLDYEFDDALNQSIWINSLKEDMETMQMYQFALCQNDQFDALILATYQYYRYILPTSNNKLQFQFNEPYSIVNFNINNETINTISLVSTNRIAIDIIGQIIHRCTLDQLKLIISALEPKISIHMIITLPINSTLPIDVKYSDNNHKYSWDKALDQQIFPC